MTQPWFPDPNLFGAWFGALVGGVGGTLLGLLGAVTGVLAPRGRGRSWILGAWTAALGLGIVLALVGLAAWVVGQPYAIWYPFLLSGVVFAVVSFAILRGTTAVYAAAERRRLEAEGIRKA